MSHRFQFFRAGGVDQVSLRDGDDMLALAELDQKLWVALAMPVKGTALDPETLALLDLDNDGRIRVNDILASIAWAKSTFTRPSDLLASKPAVALASIADTRVASAAKRMLSDLGTADATSISVADTLAITKAFDATVLNGDGIVIDASTDDVDLRRVIVDAIACVGSVTDRSGKPGLDKALADKFFADVDTRHAWLTARTDPARAPLGEAATAAAATALVAVRAKLDDYYLRCRLAAYDARGVAALAGQEAELVAIGQRVLAPDDAQVAGLPIAPVHAAATLPLRGPTNPVWAARLDAFVARAVVPLLGARDTLTAADYAEVVDKLAAFQAHEDARPPTTVDALDAAWIARLAGPELRGKLAALVAADAALADDYGTISAVTKAVRMQRDFGRVLRNFVNFSDFYSKQDGVFQCGTLYLDARALHLCIPVSDVAKHGALAASSDAYLAYCDLTRKGTTKQIVAVLSNGDADAVFVGRNGIFYDRDGDDWDATITKIVNNPISVRAAFWSPYKKLVKVIEDGIQKRAQAAEDQSHKTMESAGTEIATADKVALADAGAPAAAVAVAPPAAAPPAAAPKPGKIDLGTIAAIGVAIGGIGTLFGALLATLFGLGVWLPFGVIALVMMISGPSMLLAWLKLRRRNLGPILDANGWAINGRARVNVSFGAAMTELAKLPPGAKRSLDDPFADKKTPWRRWVVLVVVFGLTGLWYLGKLDAYLPESATSIEVLGPGAPAYHAQLPPAPPAAAPAAAEQKKP